MDYGVGDAKEYISDDARGYPGGDVKECISGDASSDAVEGKVGTFESEKDRSIKSLSDKIKALKSMDDAENIWVYFEHLGYVRVFGYVKISEMNEPCHSCYATFREEILKKQNAGGLKTDKDIKNFTKKSALGCRSIKGLPYMEEVFKAALSPIFDKFMEEVYRYLDEDIEKICRHIKYRHPGSDKFKADISSTGDISRWVNEYMISIDLCYIIREMVRRSGEEGYYNFVLKILDDKDKSFNVARCYFVRYLLDRLFMKVFEYKAAPAIRKENESRSFWDIIMSRRFNGATEDSARANLLKGLKEDIFACGRGIFNMTCLNGEFLKGVDYVLLEGVLGFYMFAGDIEDIDADEVDKHSNGTFDCHVDERFPLDECSSNRVSGLENPFDKKPSSCCSGCGGQVAEYYLNPNAAPGSVLSSKGQGVCCSGCAVQEVYYYPSPNALQ